MYNFSLLKYKCPMLCILAILSCSFILFHPAYGLGQKATPVPQKAAIKSKKNVTKPTTIAELPDVIWPPILWPKEGVTFHRLKSKQTNDIADLKSTPTVLIVGGIQGDEPGGFSAASLLVTNYTITKGEVWVVPSLNFNSMVTRNRGTLGDMNRKFAYISKDDPDKEIIQHIKVLIEQPEVSLVLNLHDGSGFYRPQHEDDLHSPKRWGQSLIIDNTIMKDSSHKVDLEKLGSEVLSEVNKRLVKPEHRLYLHNTRTPAGNKEMEKTLSYYAYLKGKPAFGLEASKEFSTEYRAYYHLLMIEAFLKQYNVEFKRDFSLTPKGILAALNRDVKLSAEENRIVLPLENARQLITMLPMKKRTDSDLKPSKPIMTVIQKNNSYQILYGNRFLTQVKPVFMDFDNSLNEVEIVVDDMKKKVKFGEVLKVGSTFSVSEIKGIRVNAIGAQKGDPKRNGCESGVVLTKKDFIESYSVDNAANLYRIELYKGKAFAGMILIDFSKKQTRQEKTATLNKGVLSEQKGQENSLGF
ncbi:M99 family carboxypeptidase catalytic domain-containing protein [Desulfovibrio litoralis]|uniref:Carboxypeptidase controlling helical cell shape n=1 Tax=Desulfovibrio litoralis DSM 11393 TaxID=1121455 RepID=A0A1M7RSI1_9BACT|nr:M99 family carboxypeptidase catalytic domain-containing protein [Desulfovibrio litoralis]SHN49245.1 Carboxypeptidase controlling helical cell shape [Desulfovibrio litoralis DSM 11393]